MTRDRNKVLPFRERSPESAIERAFGQAETVNPMLVEHAASVTGEPLSAGDRVWVRGHEGEYEVVDFFVGDGGKVMARVRPVGRCGLVVEPRRLTKVRSLS